MPDQAASSPFANRYDSAAMVRRLLTEQALKHWRRYAVGFILMAISAGCTALSAYLLGDVINQAYVHRNLKGIIAVGIATFTIFAIKGAATYGHTVILSRIGVRIIAANQRRMFDKLLNESIGFFADRHSSEFIARLTAGANSASRVIDLLVTAVGRDLLSLIGLVTVMVVEDPVMSLVTVVVVPPAMLGLRKIVRRIRSIAHNQFTSGTQILETMQETLQGLRIVKAFTLEDAMRARLDRNVSAVESASFKMARVANRASPLMETLGGFAISLAVVYSGYRVIATGAEPGQFFSFMAAFLLAYEPAKRLARLNLDLTANLVGVRMLFEVIDSPASEPNDDHKPALKVAAARVEFADVRFAYRPAEPVIRNMSFVAEPGKVTALVGTTGGGKSTVLNLILRFYEADGGTITVDGQDIATISRSSLRRQIALVGQNVHLFRGSVRENIAFGKLGASDAEIVAAAKAAHAHDFISAYPAGYDTAVGEHGAQLSGGQRQRIAIARALIRNAPLILLDEATAALDSESERYVQEAIAELCKGRTTIVIAHRLPTVMHADRILVIEAGAIVEAGRHEELLRKGGRYASFYRLQLEEPAPAQPAREPVAAAAGG